jgi:hypothetical protein
MRERFFVAQISNQGPELEGVYWCKTKDEAVAYAQEWREKYPSDAKDVVLAKLLNIPLENTSKQGETSMKTCGTCGYFVPNKCKRLFKARLANDKADDCDFHFRGEI